MWQGFGGRGATGVVSVKSCMCAVYSFYITYFVCREGQESHFFPQFKRCKFLIVLYQTFKGRHRFTLFSKIYFKAHSIMTSFNNLKQQHPKSTEVLHQDRDKRTKLKVVTRRLIFEEFSH